MSLAGHLEELRKRIIGVIIFFLMAAIAAFIYIDKLVYILKLPAEGVIENFIFLTPTEVFISCVRIAVLSGFILSIPFILIQLGLFLMPAIPRQKRRGIFIWLGISFLLALAGIMFSYFVAVPFALKFLINFAPGAAMPAISIGKYFSFVSSLILVSAGIFQIPIIIILLSQTGIVDIDFLCRNRKYVVVAIFIIAAIITPTQDIINMLIFALPMWLLYETGILISRLKR